MEIRTEDFLGLLIESRLLDAESSTTAFQRWRDSTDTDANDPADWRRWLVEQKLITAYQSSLLGRGHTEGYFLGNYKILDRIGRGRMAGVYRAVDNDGSVVAIKVLPPSKAKDPVLLARFQREASLAQRLDHPNVVSAREVGETGGFNYLVMDYLEGETLDAVLERREKLGVDEAINLLEQALAGLQHIHEKGLVHRDIKPGNMMLTPPPVPGQTDVTSGRTLKILDFGLSRVADEEPVAEPAQDVQLTAAGAMLGTPDYAAPEQARDARSADIRADIYSLGCLAYHLLAGRPPFPDNNAVRQMVRHATETPSPLDRVRPEAPLFLQDILNQMLAKDPAERFATPDEALQALQAPTRETKSFLAVQPPEDFATRPDQGVAKNDSSAVSFDFSGADAPTAKQEVFTPLPAVAATTTIMGSNTPPEIGQTPEKNNEENDTRSPVCVPSREKKKLSPARPSNRTMPEKPFVRVVQNASRDRRATPKWYVNRRDAGMFAAGATTVLLALALGALFSWITRS